MAKYFHVALAADRNYHMQLSIVVSSICRHFDFDRAELVFHIFYTGLTSTQMRGTEREAADSAVEFIWHPVDLSLIHGAPLHGHISLATYFRILAFDVLSEELERVLYLDSDIVVCSDLSQLADTQVPRDFTIGAVQDSTCYQFRTDMVRARSRLTGEVVYEESGIQVLNWGIPPDAPYFNAGVLLVNLERWRLENLTSRALAALFEARRHLTYWDQDVLNALLWNRWHPLPIRWNVTPGLMDGKRRPLIYAQEEIRAALRNPGILHYATHRKPWIYGYKGPWSEEWQNALTNSSWVGWRPRWFPHLVRACRGHVRKFIEGVHWHLNR